MRSTDTLGALSASLAGDAATRGRLLKAMIAEVKGELMEHGVSHYRLGQELAEEIAIVIQADGYNCSALPELDGAWRVYAELQDGEDPWGHYEAEDYWGER